MKNAVLGLVLGLSMPLLVAVTATPAAASDPSCGSGTYRAPNGALYLCSFSDDFSGTSLDLEKWGFHETEADGATYGGDCWVDDPDNIRVSGGTLKLTSRHEDEPFTCESPAGDFTTEYTSASLYSKFSQTYGRFEFRAKFPSTKIAGLHGALWLHSKMQEYGEWPTSGEIDVAEYYTQYPDRAVPYIHYLLNVLNLSPVTNTRCMIADPWNMHTYVLEWTREILKITYDGVTCLEHRIGARLPLIGSAPFDKPFVILLSQVLGSGTNAFDPERTPLPATTEIDWVRAWTAEGSVPDTTKPSAALTSPAGPFQTGSTANVGWTASDRGGSGIQQFTLARKRAPYNGNFGATTYSTVNGSLTSTSATLAGGWTDCFAIRAIDGAGNVGAFSPWRCTSLPLDDRALTRSTGWRGGSSSAYLQSTYLRAAADSRVLSKAGAQVRRIGVVATMCARCGSISIRFRGSEIKKVSLYSSTTKYRQLIVLPPLSSVQTGTVSVTTSGAKSVYLDGLALSRG